MAWLTALTPVALATMLRPYSLSSDAAMSRPIFVAFASLRNTFRKGFNETDLVLIKNTRFGPDNRFNLQIGAEIIDLFNQRPRTIGGTGAQVEALSTGGVGAQTAAFALPQNANFLNYDVGTFTGRTITMRAKFIC